MSIDSRLVNDDSAAPCCRKTTIAIPAALKRSQSLAWTAVLSKSHLVRNGAILCVWLQCQSIRILKALWEMTLN
jgi:hypothetical protein